MKNKNEISEQDEMDENTIARIEIYYKEFNFTPIQIATKLGVDLEDVESIIKYL